MNKILIVGTCTKDIIYGESYFGGAAGGIALNLGKLGVSVGILSVLGSDSFSNKYKRELESRKVNIDLVKNRRGKIPTLEVISTENTELARKFNYYGVDKILENLKPSRSKLNKYSWVHVVNTPKKLADYLAENFNDHISYCPGSLLVRNNSSLSVDLLKKSNLIFANQEEYSILQERIDLKDLFGNKLKAILITKGNKGITLKTKNYDKNFPVKKVKVVDVTGAGDAFFVGFMKKYLVSNNLRKSVKAGIKLASTSVGIKGVVVV